MKHKQKIINDPVYGFITIPYGSIYEIIEHPYFQRLRRIKQLALSHYVFPGAVNTRFHHALGAYHLICKSVQVLRKKGVEISDEESTALKIAILLHDIGHGPYSHSLEKVLLPVSHEKISLALMQIMNEEFSGALDMAIDIFLGKYHRRFFHTLISGQLDMDRMDYLIRDSYFTGVAEGVIGYDRIIHMLNVVDDRLVVEIKGLYSVEKFLMSRRLMYWQVYLHKTVLSADKMLRELLLEYLSDEDESIPSSLRGLYTNSSSLAGQDLGNEAYRAFAKLDDTEVDYLMKALSKSKNFKSKYLAEALLNRKLHKLKLSEQDFSEAEIEGEISRISERYAWSRERVASLIFTGVEKNKQYALDAEEIHILNKKGEVLPLSSVSELNLNTKVNKRYYLAVPA